MSTGAIRSISIYPEHPRAPHESTISLRLMPADRKVDRMDVYTITEEQALGIAEQALTAARIIRDVKASRSRLAEAERIDRKTAGL